MRTAFYSLILASVAAFAAADCSPTWKESVGANKLHPYIEDAIEINDQGTDTVSFSVSQYWVEEGTPMLAVSYRSEESGEEVCDMEAGEVIEYSAEKNYVAKCEQGVAKVGVFLFVGETIRTNPEDYEACAAPNEDYVGHYVEIPATAHHPT